MRTHCATLPLCSNEKIEVIQFLIFGQKTDKPCGQRNFKFREFDKSLAELEITTNFVFLHSYSSLRQNASLH